MKAIDLHVHTTASDGTLTPAETIKYAVSKDLSAIAITDHDSVHGLKEAFDVIKNESLPIKLIPGIEMSTKYISNSQKFEVHILGYNIDYENKELNDALDAIKNERRERNKKMIAKVGDLGYHFTIEELEDKYKGSTITRSHICKHLVDLGAAKNKQDAFDKFIGVKAPCYVPRVLMPPKDAIEFIIKFGGIAVIAHPVQYNLSEAEYEKLFAEFKSYGLKGVEAIYTSNTEADERTFRKLANKLDLFITGGSDFHGKMKPDIDLGTGRGNLFIPEDLIQNIN